MAPIPSSPRPPRAQRGGSTPPPRLRARARCRRWWPTRAAGRASTSQFLSGKETIAMALTTRATDCATYWWANRRSTTGTRGTRWPSPPARTLRSARWSAGSPPAARSRPSTSAPPTAARTRPASWPAITTPPPPARGRDDRAPGGGARRGEFQGQHIQL